MTFNEFLASEEGRRKLNTEQADLLLGDLTRHGVTIADTTYKSHLALLKFEDEHPEYFRSMSEEDIRNGLQTMETMWWEYHRHEHHIPFRQLDPRAFRGCAGERAW